MKKKKTIPEILSQKPENFAEMLLETANTIVITLNSAGEILIFNRYAEELTGYAKEEVIGKNWFDLFLPKKDREKAYSVFMDILQNDSRLTNSDSYVVTRRGTEHLISWNNSVLLDSDENIECVLRIGIDITGKKWAEQSLFAEICFTEALIKSMPGLFYVMDFKDSSFTRLNNNWYKVSGYTDYELENMTLSDFFEKGQDTERCMETINKVFIDGFATMENHLLTKSGCKIPYFFNGTRMKIEDSVYLVGMGLDISERIAFEEQLRHAEKMQAISDLAGGIAHDFNNQLGVVMGFADILRLKMSGSQPLSGYIDNILTASRHANDLTMKLLAFAQKGKYISKILDLHNIILEVTSIIQRTFDRRIRINLDLASKTPFISGDPSQIHSIVMNLALNSRDAMPDGGDIFFSTTDTFVDSELIDLEKHGLKEGRYIEFKVRDTGHGIDQSIQHKIFEPFFSTRPQKSGNGMGLAAVYGTVRNHHGSISFTSENNSGATFTIYFPQARAGSVVSETITAGNSAIEMGSASILIVDDEPAVIEVFSIMLESMGYKVFSCIDGAEAVEFYRSNWKKIDLVILDMVMPVMDGKNTYLKLKEINPEVIALLCSGYSIEGKAQEILNEGINGFIQKPFNLEKLSQVIIDTLNSKK